MEMDIPRHNPDFPAIATPYIISAMVLLKKLAGIKVFKELEGKFTNIGSGIVPDNRGLVFSRVCAKRRFEPL